MKKWLYFICFLGGLFLLWLDFAQAIGGSPLTLELKGKPGETVSSSVSITNESKQESEAKVYLGDWDRDIKGENRFFPPATVDHSCAGWIEFSPNSLVLKPGDQLPVKIAVKIPQKAAGTYWAILFAEQKPRKGERTVAIYSTMRVGVKVYLTIVGTEENAGQITNLAVNPPAKEKPRTVQVEYLNSGNLSQQCTGKVELRNENGETIKKLEIEKFYVLPGAKRILEIPLKDALAPGNYTALAVVDYGAETVLAGEKAFTVEKSPAKGTSPVKGK